MAAANGFCWRPGWAGIIARLAKGHVAQELQGWIETQADADGNLPEQTATHLIAPDYYARWVARRGPIANPLLWSHAMYLILNEA